MKDLNITDVRSLPGDSAFLIDDGKTSILCDTGFAFTGYDVAKNIKEVLGGRALDYIFLTHSHYDHVLGSVYIQKYYPNVKIVAGEYAVKIFAKETAKNIMRDLDRKFATICGIDEYEDLIDNLHVDISVKDNDVISTGDMKFRVIALPGHTKCSIAYYLEDQKLLLSSETLGIYDGDKTIFPCYLAGYQMTLDSITKAKKLDINNILLPHFGLLNKEQTAYYMSNIESAAVNFADDVCALLKSAKTKEDAFEMFKTKFYHGKIKETYPIDAMKLNTSIMVNLIEKECL